MPHRPFFPSRRRRQPGILLQHPELHALNPAMPYTPILATLGYVLSPGGSQALLIHRQGRADDWHLGKYNGLGGKIERGEDVLTGLRREIREEAGLECDSLVLRGTISWPGFG